MKIFELLDALEVPHCVIITNNELLGTETTIVAHESSREILKPLDFIIHREGETRYQTDKILRQVDRKEYSQFKARLAEGKYAKVSDGRIGVVFERTRRPLKEFINNFRG